VRKAVVLAGLLIAAGPTGPPARGAKPTPPGLAEAPFKGQAAALVVRSPKGEGVDGVYLSRPEVRRLGDHFFVVGEYIDLNPATDASRDGIRTWTPVGDIVQLREYDTPEALKKAFRNSQPPGGDR
jgi:hypothetical protein